MMKKLFRLEVTNQKSGQRSFIKPEDILWVEFLGQSSVYYLKDGSSHSGKYLTEESRNLLKTMMADSFIWPNTRTAFNANYVKHIMCTNGLQESDHNNYVLFENGSKLYLGHNSARNAKKEYKQKVIVI